MFFSIFFNATHTIESGNFQIICKYGLSQQAQNIEDSLVFFQNYPKRSISTRFRKPIVFCTKSAIARDQISQPFDNLREKISINWIMVKNTLTSRFVCCDFVVFLLWKYSKKHNEITAYKAGRIRIFHQNPIYAYFFTKVVERL